MSQIIITKKGRLANGTETTIIEVPDWVEQLAKAITKLLEKAAV